MKKILVTWEQVDDAIKDLVLELKPGLQFDGIYGIPRGGLVLAVALSHALNLPLLVHPTENSLVVDDISDTGITLSNVKHKSIVCLYSSEWTKTEPDHFVYTKNDPDSWIVFPWENHN